MKSHKRKMVAPIVVTVIMILYYAVYFGFLISVLDGIPSLLHCTLLL